MSISSCFRSPELRRHRKSCLRALLHLRIRRYKKGAEPPTPTEGIVHDSSDESSENANQVTENLLRDLNMASAESSNSQTNVERARQLMTVSDATNLMDDRNSLERQISVVQTLQNLAYYDADTGGISDMADWCLRSWLRILAHHPQEVRVLSGTSTFDRPTMQKHH